MVICAVATGGSVALGPDGARVTSASVGQLFIAGVIPGLMLATLLGAHHGVSRLEVRLSAACRGRSWGERFKAFRECIWGLLLIFLVLGGIYRGWFTPTEAAAVSAVYAFIIAVFVYRDMSLKDVPRVLLGSAKHERDDLYIITNAVLFSFLMTSEQIRRQLTAWIVDMGVDWWTFLIFVNILLLVAGNVMEASSIVLITALILFPIAVEARRASGAFRHPDGGQHGGRHVPSAGRPQSLCRVGHRRRWALPNSPSRCGRGC